MRIRTIKPEFFLHEGLYDLEASTKLPVRLVFAGLWCAADRDGRFKWEPRKLKAQILPYDNLDFSRVLDALTTRGFLVRYASASVEYGWIPSFHRHQFINPREKSSDLPSPPDGIEKQQLDAQGTRDERVDDACSTRLSLPFPSLSKGECEGKPQLVNAAKRFSPPTLDEVKLHAAKVGLPENEAERFFGYYGSNGWRVGKNPMKDWHMAMTSWRVRWEEQREKFASEHCKPQTIGEKNMAALARSLQGQTNEVH